MHTSCRNRISLLFPLRISWGELDKITTGKQELFPEGDLVNTELRGRGRRDVPGCVHPYSVVVNDSISSMASPTIPESSISAPAWRSLPITSSLFDMPWRPANSASA